MISSEEAGEGKVSAAGGDVLFFGESADVGNNIGNVVVTEAFDRLHFAGALDDNFFQLGVGFLLYLSRTELGGLKFHGLGVSGGTIAGSTVTNQTFIAVNGLARGRVAGRANRNGRKHPGYE